MSVKTNRRKPPAKRRSRLMNSARQTAANAAARPGDRIDEAPLIALAGGLAVGALIAALLPKTAKETELLGRVGERLTGHRAGRG